MKYGLEIPTKVNQKRAIGSYPKNFELVVLAREGVKEITQLSSFT